VRFALQSQGGEIEVYFSDYAREEAQKRRKRRKMSRSGKREDQGRSGKGGLTCLR